MKRQLLLLTITLIFFGCKKSEMKKETTTNRKSASEYSPIGFIKELKKENNFNVFSTEDDLSKNWIKRTDLDSLISLVDSNESCSCYLNPLSSYIPKDSAEVGGFAIEFLKAFKENRKVNLGSYCCPKVDKKEAVELKDWFKNYNNN
jgi:hypothetical protein